MIESTTEFWFKKIKSDIISQFYFECERLGASSIFLSELCVHLRNIDQEALNIIVEKGMTKTQVAENTVSVPKGCGRIVTDFKRGESLCGSYYCDLNGVFLCSECREAPKEDKLIFNKMIEMEKDSAKNPNLMQTYEVMWKALKKDLENTESVKDNSQGEKAIFEALESKSNKRDIGNPDTNTQISDEINKDYDEHYEYINGEKI